MQLPDVSKPFWFFVATIVVFAVVIGRYLLIAGIFHLAFYRWGSQRWQQRKINSRQYKKHQFRKEVFWSTVTAITFAVSGAATLLLWQKGFTKVYFNVHEYPLWWLPLSLIIALTLHETYYYWLHR